MIINKTTYWFKLKQLDTEPNEPTNQNLLRVATYKKTFGTR